MATTREILDELTGGMLAELAATGAGEHGLTARVHGKEGFVGSHDRWVVRIVIEDAGVVLHTIDPTTGAWQSRALAAVADVDAAFADLVPAIAVALDQLTVHRLEPGQRYRIAEDFADVSGQPFIAGEVLVFESLSHVPYHDGYTLRFEGRAMLVAGDSDIYARFGVLVVPAA